MGYRSDVRCLIWGSEEKMSAFLTEKRLIDPDPVFQHFKKSLSSYVVDADIDYDPETKSFPLQRVQILDLQGEDWKWYESYPDVIAWDKFMRKAHDTYGLDFYFVRVGEGDGDRQDVESECTSDAYPFLSVSRPMITTDIPDPVKTIEI